MNSENPAAATPENIIFRCGSLIYSKKGLFVLFAWMLWGDFCFTLMEAVVPSILPLKLRSLDAPNALIGLIMTTLPGIFNVTVTPWLSFKSDRHRSRWGRRLPFILGTMPFLAMSMILIGFSSDIGGWVHGAFFGGSAIKQAQVTIVLLAVFAASFDFFNMFVNTVYWYLFNDVVPVEWMGRFMGWFRVVGTLTSAAYNFFIFKYAESHVREIFLGAALLYLIGFGLMCLRVKEGTYPPPSDEGAVLGFFGKVRLFARECFTSSYYWYIFLQGAVGAIGGSIVVFDVFFLRSLGLSLDNIGKMGAISAITVPICLLFAGSLVDRWHPVRVCAYFGAFDIFFFQFANWVWLFVPATTPLVFVAFMMTFSAFFRAPYRAVNEVANMTRLMRMFPHEQYGQFSGAMALVRAVGLMAGGLLSGLYIDMVRGVFPEGDYYYRFNFLWMGPMVAAGFYFHYKSYRIWKRLGGIHSYVAPTKPFRPRDLSPCPEDDGKPCAGILGVLAIPASGLLLLNCAWIAYYFFWDHNPSNITVFSIAAGLTVVTGWVFFLFIRRMERP